MNWLWNNWDSIITLLNTAGLGVLALLRKRK